MVLAKVTADFIPTDEAARALARIDTYVSDFQAGISFGVSAAGEERRSELLTGPDID